MRAKRKGLMKQGHLNYLAIMCKFVSLLWTLLLCTVDHLSTMLSTVWETKMLRTYSQARVLLMVWNSHVKKKKKNQMWPCAYFGSWNSLRLLIGDPLNHSCLWLLSVGKGFSFHTFFGGVVICKNIHFDIIGTLARAPLPQTWIAEQQPHVLIVSTHHWRWHWT